MTDLDRVEMMLIKQGRLLAALTEFVLFESAVLKHGKRASEHQSFLALEQALRELKGYDYEPMYKSMYKSNVQEIVSSQGGRPEHVGR